MLRALLCCLLSATCFAAAPGGHIVEAISDECDSLSPVWSAGLRGMPEVLTTSNGLLSIRSIDNGDDDYPSAEDMISTYADQLGRPLGATEGPSVVTWVWFPPFVEWPSGFNASMFREWLGFRVTAYDRALPSGTGFYFPGIFVSTDDAGPCLIARVGDGYAPDVTIARVHVDGWWTLGLAWNEEGETEYYAAPGRVTLTDAHLLHRTPRFQDPVANRTLDALIGNFWALRMTFPSTGQLSTNWTVDHWRVYVQKAPALPKIAPSLQSGEIRLDLAGFDRGFRYLLQRSDDLAGWETIEDFVSDGQDRTILKAANGRSFHRVARP